MPSVAFSAVKTSGFLSTGFLMAALTAAEAAPRQLYEKSVVVRWSETATEKGADGRVLNTPITRDRIAYISSAGRVFLRAIDRTPGGDKNAEVAPGASAGSLAFRGDSAMEGTAVFAGFARRLAVKFDPSFSSCNASVIYGKSGGPTTWKSTDGTRTYELMSVTVGAISCSIQSGNAAAR